MARNIEIKAHVIDLNAVTLRASEIADGGPVHIEQDDTFFKCDNGRFKLRCFSDASGELIFYQRPDDDGPKESFYVRTPTTDPAGLREALTLACGQVGRVRKKRTLFLSGRTRIHLDQVEHLGSFLELEVVLRDGESADEGVAEAHALMSALNIQESQLVTGSYLDLLSKTGTPQST